MRARRALHSVRILVVITTLSAGLAVANPVRAEPTFGPSIEGYTYDTEQSVGFKVDVCRSGRPGTRMLRDLALATFPMASNGGTDGCREIINPFVTITSTCGAAGGSPTYSTCWSNHASGRAFDFSVGSNRALGDAFVAWLFETDGYGNQHWRARRLGVQQVFWYDHCWDTAHSGDRSVVAASQMRSCLISSSHRFHVHVSLTNDGADGLSTYWNPTAVPPPPQPLIPVLSPLNPQDLELPTLRYDWSGDGKTDMMQVTPDGQSFLWYGATSGFSYAGSVATGNGGDPVWLRFGDFNGDGKTDMMQIATDGQSYLWYGATSGLTYAGSKATGNGGEPARLRP